MSILTAEVQRADMYLAHGIDISLSISYPQTSLIAKHDWIQDKQVNDCIICHVPFTFVTRRHHCRRCGRVFCDKCCPKSLLSGFSGTADRLCKLCDSIIKLDQQNIPADQFTINQYFEQEFLIQALDSNDFVLFAEGLRLIQNSLRNTKTRSELLQYGQTLFSKIAFYLKQAIQTLSDTQKFQFIDTKSKQMTQGEAKSIIQHTIGLCINLTATKNQEYGIYILKTDVIDLMIQIMLINVDLVRQEGIIWLLKNISQIEQGSIFISKNASFMNNVLSLFDCGVRNIEESLCALLSNIMSYIPSTVVSFYQSSIWSKLIVDFRQQQPGYQSQIILFLSNFYNNNKLKTQPPENDFLGELVQIIRQDVLYDDQSGTMALNENYIVASTLKSLCLLIDNQELSKIICNSVSSMTGIITRMSRHDLLSSVYASQLLKLLLTVYPAQTYKIINGSKTIKSLFVDVMTHCISSHFPQETVRDNSREIFKIVESFDQNQILTLVKQNQI